MTAFISNIFADLRSGAAFYHPSGEDITKWFNCSRELARSVIRSVSKDSKDRQLWEETTPAKGRNRHIIKFLQYECDLLSEDIIGKATSNFEIATRFQTSYPEPEDEVKLHHHIVVLAGTLNYLTYRHLSKSQRGLREAALPVLEITQYGHETSARTQRIIAFAEKSLNDYLHERTDQLPKYEEIGRVVTPQVTRSRVEQILSSHLPPEAINFWTLNKRGKWRRTVRLLNCASLEAERFFSDSSYYPMDIETMAKLFDLDNDVSIRAIRKHLSAKQANLWRQESERIPCSKTRCRIRFLKKVARKYQNNPGWRLPTQEEIGQKLGICQTNVSRISRQWLPSELSALWAVHKNQPNR